MSLTKLENLINPEVMADMISAKIEQKIIVSKIAKVDTTLQGRPGNEVTVPQYKYIGDAADIAEGVACGTTKLEASSTSFTIKKAMKGTQITDEAILSGYGDPLGESERQLALAIANKVDNDVMEVLSTVAASSTDPGVQLVAGDGTAAISYAGIVDAEDLFDEEVSSEKVLYVHPKQMTQLRKDGDFLSADKYDGKVMMSGEIGRIGTCRVVRSKKVQLDETGAYYLNPIVKLNNDAETEEDAPAITIYLKRDTQVEPNRLAGSGITEVFVNKHYGVALTNTSKVVLAKFKK